MAYAVFVNDRRNSEWFPTEQQAVCEAFSKGLVWKSNRSWDRPALQENAKIINSGKEEIAGK